MAVERRRLVDEEEGRRFPGQDGARLGAARNADELVVLGKDRDQPRLRRLAQLVIGLRRDRMAPAVGDDAVGALRLAGARRGGDDRPEICRLAGDGEGDGAAIGLAGDDDPAIALLAGGGDLLEVARDVTLAGVRPAVLPARIAVELDDVPAARREALQQQRRRELVLRAGAVEAVIPDDEAERRLGPFQPIFLVGRRGPIGVHRRGRHE